MRHGGEGSFLIRASESSRGKYSRAYRMLAPPCCSELAGAHCRLLLPPRRGLLGRIWVAWSLMVASAAPLLARSLAARPVAPPQGDYSLSVLDQKQPKHYKVTSRGGTLHLSGCADQTFPDLKALVDYYTSASKGRTSPLDKLVVEKMDAAFSAPGRHVCRGCSAAGAGPARTVWLENRPPCPLICRACGSLSCARVGCVAWRADCRRRSCFTLTGV